MKSKKLWVILIVIVALAGAAFFFRDSITSLWGGSNNNRAQAQGGGPGAGQGQGQGQGQQQTITIRPAADVAQVSAAGNITLSSQHKGVLKVEGIITEIAVEPGDTVSAGDLLVKIDASDLERAVQRAQLALAVSQNQLDQLKEPADKADVDAAWADLAAAKENLAEVQAGPTAAELQSAQAALAAAQESYQELVDGLSEPELVQLAADMHKSFITLQQAQDAYNEIAYRGDIGRTSQASDLQTATIDYDTAKAAYEVATEPAKASEMQSALKAIADAQVQLDDLDTSAADLASAQAQVASSEASLASLLNGPSDAEVQAAEFTIEQAQLDLDEAKANLDKTELRAEIDGTVLTVDVEVGQRATEELSALTYADLTELELPVYVAEVDIGKVEIGQPVNIGVDALPDQVFSGEVSRIAPISESDSGVVNYKVTVQLNDLELEDGVLPGMTAVATILADSTENAWLVPTSALVEFEGDMTLVVMRQGQERRITVTPTSTQGEWTVVQSDELQAGDEVQGHVTSFVGEDNNQRGFRGPFGPPR